MSKQKTRNDICDELSSKMWVKGKFSVASADNSTVELILTYRETDDKEQHQFVLNGYKSNKYTTWGRMMGKLEGLLFENNENK